MTSLVHIYHGAGKGKTTAAVGLAVRCAGRGGRVVLAQFLKDGTSGECRALAGMKGVTLLAANPTGRFSFSMTEEEKRKTAAASLRMFEAASGFAARTGARLLILDEVLDAVACGFLREETLIDFLDHRPEGLETVLTGRAPSDALLSRADYVTEMVLRRHPYEKGVAAREGIEF